MFLSLQGLLRLDGIVSSPPPPQEDPNPPSEALRPRCMTC